MRLLGGTKFQQKTGTFICFLGILIMTVQEGLRDISVSPQFNWFSVPQQRKIFTEAKLGGFFVFCAIFGARICPSVKIIARGAFLSYRHRHSKYSFFGNNLCIHLYITLLLHYLIRELLINGHFGVVLAKVGDLRSDFASKNLYDPIFMVFDFK